MARTINQTQAIKGQEIWTWASKEQKEAWEYGPKPLCLSGGYGSGKTFLACRKILRLMDAFPGYRVVVARRRWVHLVKTTMATFFKVCKPEMYNEGRRSDSEKILRLNNGSELIWMHLEDGEEVANIIPGLEINALFIDQAEEVDEELYDKLSSRLGRWDRAIVPDEIVKGQESLGKTWKWYNQRGEIIPPAYSIIACNPDNEMHWIYRRFHPDSQEHYEKKIPEYDNAERGSVPKPTGNMLSYHDLGYKMITMASTSNKFLTKQNISALLVNDESFIKRYVRGEWGSPEGSIHIIHPSSLIPGNQLLVDYLVRTCRLMRSMDYGDSAPTCVAWAAIDREDNIIIYREYYEPDRLISDHRIAIDQYSRDKEGLKEEYTFNLADPSIFSKMPQAKGGRWCVADEYCLDPKTRILTADLRHVPCGDLRVGQKIIGFDEEPGFMNRKKNRRYREATITGTKVIHQNTYRITLEDGTSVISSSKHRWMANPTGEWRKWMTTDSLRVGQKLLRLTDVWDYDSSRDGGYLAAAFDGEGFLTQKPGCTRTGFSQNPNPMLDKVKELLDERGIPYGLYPQKRIVHLTVGARHDVMKLIGMIRPVRLLPKFNANLLGRVHVNGYLKIVSIEPLGINPVISFQTSTKTCIAEGLMSHNCDVKSNPHTAIFWRPADNNELGTRNRINEYLRVDPKHKNPFTHEMGAPHLYFITRTADYPYGCSQIVKQTRSQRRLRLGTDLGKPIFSDERDENITDHAYDAGVRYVISSRPPLAKQEDRANNPNSFNQVRLRTLKFHRYKKRVA